MSVPQFQGKGITRGFDNYINRRGVETLIGTQSIKAIWQETEATRVQRFLKENEWEKAVFDVYFPAAAVDAPYNLRSGVQITLVSMGWTGVYRRIPDLEQFGDSIAFINGIVILTQRT